MQFSIQLSSRLGTLVWLSLKAYCSHPTQRKISSDCRVRRTSFQRFLIKEAKLMPQIRIGGSLHEKYFMRHKAGFLYE